MKSILYILTIALITTPHLTHAQQNLQNFLGALPAFFGEILLPFLYSIAFLAFVYNAIRYFVIGGANEDAQSNARSLATYSLAAFVFLLLFAGIVNLLSTSIGLEGQEGDCPDYVRKANGGTCPVI